ncbi:tRNA-dihydrouridine synthase [Patescibacteria group bacterium]|nr:tRNA-dihydrouridine synthase [Patescibacteria group bacterium]
MKDFWNNLPKPIIALAPMAGINNIAFRIICKKQGADVVYSEMISADGLYYQGKKTLTLLKISAEEKPVVIQLFGKDPAKFPQAVKVAEKLGASGIDINFGCPAKRVISHGGGINLMRDLNLCHKIVKAALDNTELPVSVKLRSSINIQGKKITALDFLKKISDLPISAVMIHGRSYEQGFLGEINYKIIKDARKYFKGIILANGGITTPEKAFKALKEAKADGLGLARGTYGRPWLFQQIKDYLQTKKFTEPSWPQKKKIILKQAELALKHQKQHGLIELRKHLLWYVKCLPYATDLRKELVKVKTIQDIKKILSKI